MLVLYGFVWCFFVVLRKSEKLGFIMLQGKGDKPTEATEEAKSEESAVTQVLPSLCTSSWNV